MNDSEERDWENVCAENRRLRAALEAYLEWEEAENTPNRSHSACVALLTEAERLAREALQPRKDDP